MHKDGHVVAMLSHAKGVSTDRPERALKPCLALRSWTCRNQEDSA